MAESTKVSTSPKRLSTSRSSADLPPQPSSPQHHHGLHFRFRSGSSASHTENPSQPAPEPTTEASDRVLKTEAVRSAKRILHANVRDDWEYPETDVVGEVDDVSREATSYACRETGSSDLDPDDSGNSHHGLFGIKENNPYKFENPDAVATSMTEKKRKRRRVLEEEMDWNDGLRTWSHRRDAWTKAVRNRPKIRSQHSESSESVHSPTRRDRFASNSSKTSNWPLKSGSATSSDPSVPSSSSTDSIDVAIDSESSVDGPWLPIFPPIIPAGNIVRANIKPSAYNAIYSKVVIQSLTPSVPIPLTHMTKALVEGWKAEGAWPPPSSVAASAVLREGKRKTSSLLSVMRMRRAHGQGHNGHSQGPDGIGTTEKANEKVKRGLGAVKKALGVTPEDGDEFGIDYEDPGETEANAELNKGLVEAD